MLMHKITTLRHALASITGSLTCRVRKSPHMVAIGCCLALLGGLVIWAGHSDFAATPVDAAGRPSLKLKLTGDHLPTFESDRGIRTVSRDDKTVASPQVTPEPSPTPFGDALLDFPQLADFDGDGKIDVAYRRDSTATYSYIRSIDGVSQDIQFGQSGDNGLLTGDYDGDSKADPAVFRCSTVGTPCAFLYKSSLSGNTVTVQWGGIGVDQSTSVQVVAYPGDFDGDGKYDFCVYRLNTSTALWEFLLLRSSDSGTETIPLGNFNTDYLVPGDYDGDGKSDFMLGRTGAQASTPIQWTLLTRTGGPAQAPITFARSDDIPTPADYDGDGKTDIAVRRRSDTTFQVRRSSDATTWVVTIGLAADFPAATWNVQ